jgi:hypothetical protein
MLHRLRSTSSLVSKTFVRKALTHLQHILPIYPHGGRGLNTDYDEGIWAICVANVLKLVDCSTSAV